MASPALNTDEEIAAHADLEGALCAAFEAWRSRENIQASGDALELLSFAELQPDQRAWLQAFIALWEASGAI